MSNQCMGTIYGALFLALLHLYSTISPIVVKMVLVECMNNTNVLATVHVC